MRQITCAAAAVLMATGLACSPRDRQETASRVDSVAEDVREEARGGAREAREEAREARAYSSAQRSEFRRDLDLQLKKLDAEIAELERTTKRGADRTRDRAVVQIRSARKSVNRSLGRLASATESNWDEVRSRIRAAVDSLDRAVRALRPDARPMGGAGPS